MPKIMRCTKINVNWEVYSDKCLHLKRKKKAKRFFSPAAKI